MRPGDDTVAASLSAKAFARVLRVSYPTARRRLAVCFARGLAGVRVEGRYGREQTGRYVVELAHLETVRAACERRELRDEDEAVAA